MGKTLVYYGFKPHFGDFLKDFVLKVVILIANFCWVTLWNCIFHVFGSISSNFLRSDFDHICENAKVGIEERENQEMGSDQIEEREVPKMDYEVKSVCNASTSKYQVFSGNNFRSFIEEPHVMSFTVQEMFVISNNEQGFHKDHEPLKNNFPGNSVDFCEVPFIGDVANNKNSEAVSCSGGVCGGLDVATLPLREVVPRFIDDVVVDSNSSEHVDFREVPIIDDVVNNDNSQSVSHSRGVWGGSDVAVLPLQKVVPRFVDDVVVDSNSSKHVDFCELNGEKECVKEGKTESAVCNLSFEEQEALSFTQLYFCEKGETDLSKREFSDQPVSSLPNSDDFWAVIHELDDFSGDFDSDSDEILSDRSPSEAFELETPVDTVDEMVDFHGDSPSSLDHVPFNQTTIEFIDVNSISITEQHPPKDELPCSSDELYRENTSFEDSNGVYANKEVCDEGDNDQNESDVLLEQKELIRQMKKEMRHLKSGGLPIILEDSESPRVEDDLRPLKIDDKIGYKDCMDEIQAVYKGYLDKMRKLDILSQQTMYAIGLLQLKNQHFFAWNKKISVPIIKSLLVQNFWSSKLRRHEDDPVEKTIKDFQRDLQFVYIGQICLSWEILKWQYHKSEELQSYDPEGFHHHNQASGEFQKFQVLLQRFVEDEPFHHGPRVQHYVKSRCDLPSLLQVPLVKDDSRTEWRGKGEGGTPIGMLKEVIRATMCVFWEFLRADKDETAAWTQMGIHGVEFNLQDPLNIELLQEIRSNLQKKEKMLKDLGRSGNCIVKKFQKHQDHRLTHEMLIAQVELRLISWVLHIQRLTTDHLLWCHKKLSMVNLTGRKVYVESSFVLFPC